MVSDLLLKADLFLIPHRYNLRVYFINFKPTNINICSVASPLSWVLTVSEFIIFSVIELRIILPSFASGRCLMPSIISVRLVKFQVTFCMFSCMEVSETLNYFLCDYKLQLHRGIRRHYNHKIICMWFNCYIKMSFIVHFYRFCYFS